jgi:hypothetical protein
MSPTAKSSRRAPDPDAVEIGELYRTATELRDAARVVDDALHVGEILPKKCRQAVTHADHCNWCDKPFAGSKRFVILDHDCGDVWSCFGLRSICFDCFKEGDPRDSHSGISAENRKTRQCNGCGEPISIPVPAPGHRWRSTFRWFDWGVCSMRCYQRYYRKRKRERGGSTNPWKGRAPPPCEACKKPVPPTRRGDARFCSNKCRQWTYRRRRAARAGAAV